MDWRSKNNATLGKTSEYSGWLENMNRAVTFLEESLTGEVVVGHVAQMACCSSYHFNLSGCLFLVHTFKVFLHR